MQRDDTPLLQWSRPAATVLLFPLTSRVGKVRHTASVLARKHGEDANLYWKQVVAANRKHLGRIGLSEQAIDAELRAFFDAVQRELAMQSYSGRTGGDAA